MRNNINDMYTELHRLARREVNVKVAIPWGKFLSEVPANASVVAGLKKLYRADHKAMVEDKKKGYDVGAEEKALKVIKNTLYA